MEVPLRTAYGWLLKVIRSLVCDPDEVAELLAGYGLADYDPLRMPIARELQERLAEVGVWVDKADRSYNCWYSRQVYPGSRFRALSELIKEGPPTVLSFDGTREELLLVFEETILSYLDQRRIDDFVAAAEEYYSIPQPVASNVLGVWIHILNADLDDFSLDEFMSIQGEVCVSSQWEENLYTTRRKTVGLLLDGKVRSLFDRDCYSEVQEDGSRRATFEGSDRTEGWLTPARSTLVGVYVEGQVYPPEMLKDWHILDLLDNGEKLLQQKVAAVEIDEEELEKALV